jgi:hypothetical protein
MKQASLFILALLAFASCKEGWTDEHKTNYRTQCMREAAGMYETKEQVEKYCACNLDAVMKIYEHPSDIMENYDSVAIRKALQDCSLQAQR